MTTAQPENDEPAWSHLQRIAVLNNFASVLALLRVWGCKSNQTMRKISLAAATRTLRFLSSAAGESYEAYCRKHGMGCMVGLNGQIEANYHYLRGGKLRSYSLGRACVFPPSPQTKFCRGCRRIDLDRCGFTWVRRIHQVIGLELCPVHEDLLMECKSDYASLSNACDATKVMSGRLINFPTKATILATPEVRPYARLMVWRWQDNSDDRIYAMRDLATERFSHPYFHSRQPSVYEAIMGVFNNGSVREWLDYHFIAYFGGIAVIKNLCGLPLDRIPPPLLALALASTAGSTNALISQLEMKLENRRGKGIAAQRQRI